MSVYLLASILTEFTPTQNFYHSEKGELVTSIALNALRGFDLSGDLVKSLIRRIENNNTHFELNLFCFFSLLNTLNEADWASFRAEYQLKLKSLELTCLPPLETMRAKSSGSTNDLTSLGTLRAIA
jgi:hypothetical protein